MLSSNDVFKRYQEEFAVVEIDFKLRQRNRSIDKDETRPEVGRYNPGQLRPVMVILDSAGKQVFKKVGGFNNEQEAFLMADFIGGRHYRNGNWDVFRAENFK